MSVPEVKDPHIAHLFWCGMAATAAALWRQNLLHAFLGVFFWVCWWDARGRCYQNILILVASHIIQIKPWNNQLK